MSSVNSSVNDSVNGSANGPSTTGNDSSTGSTWLRSASLADGNVVDVRIDHSTGLIADVQPARRETPRGAHVAAPAQPGRPAEVDLEGYLLLPSFVEPHAHLDKALTSDIVPNPAGDLEGAIVAWVDYLPHITVDSMIERGRAAIHELVVSGVSAVRSHANVHEGIEFGAIEALLELRKEVSHLIDIQIVCMAGGPLTGAAGANQRARFREALVIDPSIIVGGCPHLDDNPFGATDFCVDLAGEFGRPLDLHTDETLDPLHLELRYLAERVKSTGYSGTAVASHCVSLAMQPLDIQRATASECAEAGVSVVTLPQTNLFLQGRGYEMSAPRGLTALRPLLDAGVVLGAGADNVRDPFNSMGRSDPFETASLLVMAGHLLPEEAFAAVTSGARIAMGLPAVEVAVGFPADLIAVRGNDVADAMAKANQQRMVFRLGRLVASTSVTTRTL